MGSTSKGGGCAVHSFLGSIARAVALTSALVAVSASIFSTKAVSRDSSSCMECHQRDAGGLAEHPLGVKLAGRIPGGASGLPLEDGRITCQTCHLPHGHGVVEDAGARFYLRDAPDALCARCHENRAGRRDRPHARYMDTVHGGKILAGRLGEGHIDGRDLISSLCVVCHEQDASAEAVRADRPRLGGRGVGKSSRHDHFGGGWDASQETARLFDGRVGCASCHRIFAEEKSLLVAPVEHGRLCLSCHDL